MSDNNGIVRRKQNPYTQVSNTALTDQSLSLKAKGLYSVVNCFLTIPNFVLYKNHLIKQSIDRETAFTSAWNELKAKGYLIQYKLNIKKNGRFTYEYELLDVPITEVKTNNPEGGFPCVVNPPCGKPTSGKQGVHNKTNSNKTNSNKTKKTTTKKNKEVVVVSPSATVSTERIKALQKEIKGIINASISVRAIEAMISKKGEDQIYLYLQNWDKFQYQTIKNVSRFFETAVCNGYDIPTTSKGNNKVAQETNYKQRSSDDFAEFARLAELAAYK